MALRRADDRLVTIYRLRDPFTGEVRYIGQTARPLAARLSNHMSTATESVECRLWLGVRTCGPTRPKHYWLYGLLIQGRVSLIEEIEQTTQERAHQREQHWIDAYLDEGAPLLNTISHAPHKNSQRNIITVEGDVMTVQLRSGYTPLTITRDGALVRFCARKTLYTVARTDLLDFLIAGDDEDEA